MKEKRHIIPAFKAQTVPEELPFVPPSGVPKNDDDMTLIDTVCWTLPIKYSNEINYEELDFTSNTAKSYKNKNSVNESIKGIREYKNMVVEQPLTGKTFKIYGSIPKLFRGNNVNCLTILEAKQAVNELSNKLNIDLWEHNCTRCDQAKSFWIPEDINTTINNIYPANNLDLVLVNKRYKTTVDWFINEKQYITISIYDKLNELKKKQKSVYNDYLKFNSNLLRFEVQFYKERLTKLFKMDCVNFRCVFDNMSFLEDEWVKYLNCFQVRCTEALSPIQYTNLQREIIENARNRGASQAYKKYESEILGKTLWRYKKTMNDNIDVIRKKWFEELKDWSNMTDMFNNNVIINNGNIEQLTRRL